jgi:hypothetical protein
VLDENVTWTKPLVMEQITDREERRKKYIEQQHSVAK